MVEGVPDTTQYMRLCLFSRRHFAMKYQTGIRTLTVAGLSPIYTDVPLTDIEFL
jgi:hypothetical protein